MGNLEAEFQELNTKLAVKEIDDTLASLNKVTLVETSVMVDRLLDIRRILTP